MESCLEGACFLLGRWKKGAQQGSGAARGKKGDGVSKCQAVCLLRALEPIRRMQE